MVEAPERVGVGGQASRPSDTDPEDLAVDGLEARQVPDLRVPVCKLPEGALDRGDPLLELGELRGQHGVLVPELSRLDPGGATNPGPDRQHHQADP